ncbi:Mo-dependent nitrogenase C-terminal domain-containing protein [aff. Roholtiella sp. LEGE 12411]|uniref:Mo-dependent nitrogenase C-terminal domain-containing protein n=1 Tax=aff. Roholtiella sp. LEGE 12411 TaxID=1828822 RepID=UPI0018804FED|nr:Mo-dependent nitrogenase C-terminal domain-containing protein [aff. Roholtiella sp. LEGE 12411]MBE9034259.1 Mo-dependent nitrogenase C-terminal domain-containing protein [aff. Roholtiella sp. LEGE 12411]
MNFLIPIQKVDLLFPIKQWLESLEICQPKMARLLCKMIPASCPFEREIKLLGRTIAYIPPLCKLNPFYEQIIEIRFKSLSYLANECGEDVTIYC